MVPVFDAAPPVEVDMAVVEVDVPVVGDRLC
jgi:hypothetical protein